MADASQDHVSAGATSPSAKTEEPLRPWPAFVTELPQTVDQSTLVRPTRKARSPIAAFISHIAHVAIAAPVPFWAAMDAFFAFEAVRLAHVISPAWRPEIVSYSIDGVAVTHAVIFFLSSYSLGLYGRQVFNWRSRMLFASFSASALAVSATTLFETWVRFVQIGRWIVLYTFLLTMLTTLLVRMVAKGLAGRTKVRVLFVGDPAKYRYLSEAMVRDYGELYELPHMFDVRSLPSDLRVRRTLELFELLKVHEVIVEDDSEMLYELLHSWAPIVSRGGMLKTLSAFYENLLQEVPVHIVDCRMLLGSGWGIGRQSTEIAKRAFDVLLSLIGIVLMLPAASLVAVAVKLTSRGPMIYKQTRVGRFGKLFSIYKFRTMRVDAEDNGPKWASSSDERVTAIGEFLRRSHLDELPQLWNILIGQMSFVGPRPERPEFIAELSNEIPYYQLRHLVPPGLTGWAQIRYPYGASVDDAKRKLCYDLFYVRRYGLLFDLSICLKTMFAIARGAWGGG